MAATGHSVPSGFIGITLEEHVAGDNRYWVIRKGILSALDTTKGWRWNEFHPNDSTCVGSVEEARKVLAENPQLR